MKSVRALLAILIVGLLAIGCRMPWKAEPTCTEQSQAYIASVEASLGKWDDTTALMTSTPRITLGPVISSLQEQRRSMEAIVPPECAGLMHRRLVAYMGHTVDFALAFMASKPDAEFMGHRDKAEEDLDVWAKQFAALKAGAEPYGMGK